MAKLNDLQYAAIAILAQPKRITIVVTTDTAIVATE